MTPGPYHLRKSMQKLLEKILPQRQAYRKHTPSSSRHERAPVWAWDSCSPSTIAVWGWGRATELENSGCSTEVPTDSAFLYLGLQLCELMYFFMVYVTCFWKNLNEFTFQAHYVNHDFRDEQTDLPRLYNWHSLSNLSTRGSRARIQHSHVYHST